MRARVIVLETLTHQAVTGNGTRAGSLPVPGRTARGISEEAAE